MTDNELLNETYGYLFSPELLNEILKCGTIRSVKTGDVLVILEAMKMEHSIKASHNGVVSKVLITKDDQVENGAPLMIVDKK